MSDPATRASLLLRIRDPGDAIAWDQFVDLYRPVILGMARRRGMQEADADDLAQNVLASIARAIESFDHDSHRGTFRSWLRTIARNAIINAMTRGNPDQAAGGTDMWRLLDQQPGDDEASRTAEFDYRREIFRVAAEQIEDEFQPTTWRAFWLTAVDGVPVDHAAAKLQQSRGSIYTARSRVMKRLQQVVTQLDQEGAT